MPASTLRTRALLTRIGPALLLAPAAWAGPAAAQALVAAPRAGELVRMVRQDCGACHGMQLSGGLGPALTPAALREVPLDSLAATIYHGRPGTPMPPWRAMLDENEARWIAQRLQQGFPQEPTGATP